MVIKPDRGRSRERREPARIGIDELEGLYELNGPRVSASRKNQPIPSQHAQPPGDRSRVKVPSLTPEISSVNQAMARS